MVVALKQPIETCEETGASHRDKHIGGNNAGIYLKSFALNQHCN